MGITAKDGKYRVSPIFILPSEQGKRIVQEVFRLLEKHYKDSKLRETINSIFTLQNNFQKILFI